MAKLPSGMFKRKGRGYYTRRWVGGKDKWVSLGTDFDEACRRLREVSGRECNPPDYSAGSLHIGEHGEDVKLQAPERARDLVACTHESV